MTADDSPDTVREAVGVFASADTLQAAIDDLLTSGFDRAELSLLAGEDTVVAKLGHHYRKVAELEDDPTAARVCYVSPESIGGAEGALIGGLLYAGAVAATGAILVSGGSLAAAVIGAAAAGGAGGLAGTVLARLVGDHQAGRLQEQLDHGGLLLWVRTWNAADEARAVGILKRHSGRDVHLHGTPTVN
ncbi:hypothetical protein [uncultured Brevundimonas sp.]|uniref:hypothetical protein n=1 Tax=uncultured Brevundimonas sp. TaxID=213418 RepID=UPI0030EF0B8C|tara:strand:+ start:2674 stop:3240 length:567 start_codon:yes stop_codon:yes gene_type:complete